MSIQPVQAKDQALPAALPVVPIDNSNAILIQSAVRGFLVRKNYTRSLLYRMIINLKSQTTTLMSHLIEISNRVEVNWKNHLINQDLEKIVMAGLGEIKENLEKFDDRVEAFSGEEFSYSTVKFIEDNMQKQLAVHRQRLAGICQIGGFKSLEKGMEIALGSKWRRMFDINARTLISQYDQIFNPTGYKIVKVENIDSITSCTLVETDGEVRFEENPDTIKARIPFVNKMRFFNEEVLIHKVHGAELNIPYQDEAGHYHVMVVSGVFGQDPIGAQKCVHIAKKKVMELNRHLAKVEDIPEKFKLDYLKQYPLRDLFVLKPGEIVKELLEDYDYIKQLGEKLTPKEILLFAACKVEKQVKLLSLMLLKEESTLAMFLYELTAKQNPEYQQLLRNSLHFSLQKRLDLAFEQMEETINKLKKLRHENVTYETQIAASKMPEDAKEKAADKLKQLKGRGSDADKAEKYLDGLLKVPFGVYNKDPVDKNSKPEEIRGFLDRVKKSLDEAVWGHEKPKNAILEWLAQRIANGESKGECIALEGPPGTGKTTFAKEGIAKSLGRPFAFISLGGQTDSSFLVGHGYTYVGSDWGRIVQILIEKKCMDPVIYIDEVDKVSQTERGKELIGVLTALTDFSQNNEFHDKYFSGIDFDLSRALFIFSYNDVSMLDPVFKDRLQIIKVSPLSIAEKIHVAKRHLMPEILKATGFDASQITIEDEDIRFIIENYTYEAGARKLKENLFSIVRQINLQRLQEPETVKFPIRLDKEIIVKFRDHPKVDFKKIADQPMIGTVNGLYATTTGIGGLTIIQAFKTIGKEPLELTLTGSQGKVMQESMTVARSVAWNVIPCDVKKRIRGSVPEGLHIHAPEGATPKDGPSAGGAITCAIISQLINVPVRNDVAMTGEIDLTGKISKIGGLDAKLHGAKKAGVRLALVPQDNEKDLNKIKEKYVELIDDNFKVIVVKDIYEILDHALVDNPIKRPVLPQPCLAMMDSPPSNRIIES